MTSLLAAAAALAVLALAAPVSAQQTYPQSAARLQPATAPASQLQAAAMPPWHQDDGSSSDHPVAMPGDDSAAGLNSAYRGGITAVMPPGVPPPPGFVLVPPRR